MADAERLDSIGGRSSEGSLDMISEAATRVKEDVEQFVEGFDLQVIAKRIEEFGRENPLALAVSALTLGVAAGVIMRGPKVHPKSHP